MTTILPHESIIMTYTRNDKKYALICTGRNHWRSEVESGYQAYDGECTCQKDGRIAAER